MTVLSALTTSQFMTVVQNSAAGRMADMTAPQFISYLNDAIVNRYSELKTLIPTIYRKKSTISASGYTASLPSDFKQGQTLQLYSHPDSESWEYLVPSDEAWVEAGVIRFSGSVSETYYLRYNANESYYSAGNEISETIDSQARLLLQEEIKALYFSAINEGVQTDSSANSLNKSNRAA